MTSTKCLDVEKLVQYKSSLLSENEMNGLKDHLTICELCCRNLQVLDKIDKILFEKGHAIKKNGQKQQQNRACLNELQLYKYAEGNIKKNEAQKIEKHINSCNNCLSELASLSRNSLTPVTDQEQATIEDLRTFSVEEQADKILAYQGQSNQIENKKSSKTSPSLVANFFDVIKKY